MDLAEGQVHMLVLVLLLNQVFQYRVHIQEAIMEMLVEMIVLTLVVVEVVLVQREELQRVILLRSIEE